MNGLEIKDLIEQQGVALQGFRSHVDQSIADQRKALEDLELRINRGGVFGHGDVKTLDPSPEFKALDAFIRTGDEGQIKTLSVGSDPDGGYTVLPVMSANMTTRLYDQSPLRRLSRVERITTGGSFEEIDDRDECEATWVGEASARPATDTPEIGKWTVQLEEIYALQPVTQRLLDDSSRDIGAWVDGKITDKFGRSEGTAFATGDGILKPRGFLSYTAVTTADATRAAGQLQYVKTGNATGFSSTNPADCLRTLMWTLRGPYRAGAVWMMNSATASTMDKFKNGMGDYIWRDGQTAGAPPSLLGYPVEINEDMPDLGAGAFPIAFGNFKLGYCIVDRPGLKMLRDPFTSKPNVQFYAYKRVGGGLANDDAIKLLKCEA